MFTTSLIKYPPYKDLLNKYFPKPVFQKTETRTFSNHNPSLTGNAYEIYFRLVIEDDLIFRDSFKNQIENISKHFRNLKSNMMKTYCISLDNLMKMQITVDTKTYKSILKKLQLSLPKNLFFCDIENSTIRIYPIADLKLLKKINETLFPIQLSWVADHIIINVEKVISFYEKEVVALEKKISIFQKRKNLTSSLCKSLLIFAYISSPFCNILGFCKKLSLEPVYVKEVLNNFGKLNPTEFVTKAPIFFKPSLRLFSIYSTPDLIQDNKIIELKTSQRFFSSQDYLQALTYLLFAQNKDNVKIYGKIDFVILFYPLYNQYVEIPFEMKKYTATFKKKLVSTIDAFKRDCNPFS